MINKKFEELLDRFGADLASWPAADASAARSLLSRSAEARAALASAMRLETALRDTRPAIDPARAARVARLAIAAVAEREARPRFLDRILALLAMPAPRFAVAIGLTAIGIGIGAFIGNPASTSAANLLAGPPITASADDVVF